MLTDEPVTVGLDAYIPDEADLLNRRIAHAERESIKKRVFLARCDLPGDAVGERARLAAIHLMMWWHRSLDELGEHPEFVEYAAHFVNARTSAWFDSMFGVGVHKLLIDRFGVVQPSQLCIAADSSSWTPPRRKANRGDKQ